MTKKLADPALLTYDEALDLLAPHKEGRKLRVHSFEGFGGVIMGCDMDLTSVKRHLKASDHICIAGPHMTAMGHGIGFHVVDKGYIFLATDKAKITAIYKARKIK